MATPVLLENYLINRKPLSKAEIKAKRKAERKLYLESIEGGMLCRQTLTLLAIVNGIFITFETYNLKPEYTPTIDWGKQMCAECIEIYPETGNAQSNLKWMTEKVHEADDFLGTGSEHMYRATVLSFMSHCIVSDLLVKVKDEHKVDLLTPVQEVVYGLDDQIDPNGDQFDSYDEAVVYVNKLYKILGFSPW